MKTSNVVSLADYRERRRSEDAIRTEEWGLFEMGLVGLGIWFSAAIAFWAIAWTVAPIGWEDEDGFHYGRPEDFKKGK